MVRRPGTIDRWWPSTQSLDLIEGSMGSVTASVAAIFAEAANRTGGASTVESMSVPDLESAFSSVPSFDNVGSRLLLLPTRSRWVVLWTNNFLCNGFDHFLRAVTLRDGLTTIHWSAHDTTTTFQPGAMFHLRRRHGDALVERRVQVARTDARWDWFERGTPLPEEDLDGYRARRKRDRLNERRVIELLGRLDARPWDEDWYALPEQPVVSLARPVPPAAIERTRAEVITGRPAEPGGAR